MVMAVRIMVVVRRKVTFSDDTGVEEWRGNLGNDYKIMVATVLLVISGGSSGSDHSSKLLF